MRPSLLFACCIALPVASCHKEERRPDFLDAVTISGCPFTGEPISFSYTVKSSMASAITEWEWDFGDNSPAAHTGTASHTYSTAGTYTVLLSTNSGAATRIITIKDQPSSPLVAGTAGSRRWRGSMAGYILEFGQQGGTYYPDSTAIDTVFAIAAIDSQAVTMFGTTLRLSSVDTPGGKLVFTDCGPNGRVLHYYYLQDSLTYYSYWTAGKRAGKFEMHTY